MILSNYLEKEIVKFCRLRQIPLKNGIIPNKYKTEVQDFIQYKLKRDKKITDELEKKRNIPIKIELANIMNDVSFVYLGKGVHSPIEICLGNALSDAGLSKYYHSQFKIGKYIVDYAFPIAKLVVECDGREYHFADISQIERDQNRDKYLARKGWRVVHLKGTTIRRNINLCIEKIQEILKPYRVDEHGYESYLREGLE